jgi:hypothetical protein
MFNLNEYNNLVLKYGEFASWAIWDYKDEKDCTIIPKNIDDLNSKYILLALNCSGSLRNELWANFRGGKHDRKIKYACNDSKLRGAYITDLFKGIEEPQSYIVKNLISDEVINKNVDLFKQEMDDIKISKNSKFILFGNLVTDYFNKYFKPYFNNEAYSYYHYSSYSMSDKKWVEGFWKLLNVVDNFDQTLNRYKNHS